MAVMCESIMITGAGIVSAIGNNKSEVLNSLLNNESGIGTVKHLKTIHTDLPMGEVKLSDNDMLDMLNLPHDTVTNRTTLMAQIAIKEALAQAQLSDSSDKNIALISGTTVGGMDKSEQYYSEFLNSDDKNEYIATHDCGSSTELAADYFGLFSFVTTISTACSSAANAIIVGAEMIKCGKAEIVVVGGSEALTLFHLNGFNSLMILDHNRCRPFDASREGLNLGEGAAFIVMESTESAARRGVKPIAQLSGYGNSCDAFHQTASSENGEGAYLSMQKALNMAHLNPDDIQYINAHGTGTPNNDASESEAMKRLFKDKMPAMSSTKSFTGHTTSASGSIESVICLLALKHQFIPLCLGWKHIMDNGICPATEQKYSGTIKNVICNSFGFGGNDSSLVYSKCAE